MATRRELLSTALGLAIANRALSEGQLPTSSSKEYPRIGVYSSISSTRMSDYGAEAMTLYRRGISSIYVDEDRDALINAAAIIGSSEDIEIGTAWCTPGRSPVLLALAAQWLLGMSGGRRFSLGIGLNSRVLATRLGFSWEKRHEYLQDYMVAMRRIVDAADGSEIQHDGPYFKFSMPGRSHSESPMPYPPVLLKVTDLEQFRVAGATCDEVVLGQMTPLAAFEREGSALLQQAAVSSGTRPRRIGLRKMVWSLVSDDSVTAVSRLRGLIASKLADKSFGNRELAVAAGFGREADEILSRMAAGDREGAARAVSNDMWRAYGLAGTPAEVREQASRYAGKVDTLICMGSMFGLSGFDAYMIEHFRMIDAVALN